MLQALARLKLFIVNQKSVIVIIIYLKRVALLCSYANRYILLKH